MTARTPDSTAAHLGVVVNVPRGKLTLLDKENLHSEQHKSQQEEDYRDCQYKYNFHRANCIYDAKVTIYGKILCVYQFYFIT